MNSLKSLIEKYETAGPRYTSYPTALHFSEDVDRERLKRAALSATGALSLYVHIPFCENLCWFCGCTSSVCRDKSTVDEYLDLLCAELELWRDEGLGRRALRQVQFGGGTPNFLEPKQILRLGEIINKYFKVAPDCEFSTELDPRTLTEAKVEAFAKIGVNRASIGIQDTDVEVQKAVNRIQPHRMNEDAVGWLRKCGITEINADLIYGLPLQTPETFRKTIADAASLEPTRIALFGYAHVPWVKPSQKILEKNRLPSPAEKVALFLEAKESFERLGYEYVGLDHFAKPTDALIHARLNGTLHRNFQGYTTMGGLDAFAIGLTSISETKTSYRQNFKVMKDYRDAVAQRRLPIERGIILDGEDILRRGVIMDVMCALKVDYGNYGVDFKTKFSDAIDRLKGMAEDGLVQMCDGGFAVTELGRLFLRNIAMLFDARLSCGGKKYSKTI